MKKNNSKENHKNWNNIIWSISIIFFIVELSITLVGAKFRGTFKFIPFHIFIPSFLLLLIISTLTIQLLTDKLKFKIKPDFSFIITISTIFSLPLFYSNISTISFMTPKRFLLYFFSIILIFSINYIENFNFTKSMNIYFKIIFLFLVILLAGSIKFSANYNNFIGNLTLGLDKIFLYSSFFIFLFFLSTTINIEKIKFILSILTGGSIIPITYGILQYNNIGFLGIFDNPGGKAQMFSTIGNVNWFASYLMIISFVSWTLFFLSKTNLQTIISWLIANITIILIIISKTRASWVSYGLTFFLFFTLFSLKFFKKSRREKFSLNKLTVKLIKIEIPIIILMVLFYSTTSPLNKKVSIINKIKITMKKDYNIMQRYYLWKITFKMFSKHKLSGNGTGTFGRDYLEFQRKFFLKNNEKIYKYGGNAREAHNEYLQILAENGIIGFFPFLLLLFYPIYVGIIKLRNAEGESFFIILGSISILTTILIHSLVSFPLKLPVTGILFFIFSSFLLKLNESYETKKLFSYNYKKNISFFLLPLLLLLLMTTIISDTLTSLGQEKIKYHKMKEAESLLNSALNFNPFRGDTLYLLGTAQLSQKKEKLAEKNLKKSLIFVNDKGIMNNLGFIYQHRKKLKIALNYFVKSYLYESKNCETANNVAMINLRLSHIKKGIKFLKIAIKNNPYYLTAINNLADLYLKTNKIDKAEKLYKKVVSLNPDFAVKINIKKRVFSYTIRRNLFGEYSRAFYGLGQIASKRNNKLMGEKFFVQSLKFQPYNDMVMYRFSLFYIKYGEIVKAKSLLRKIIDINGPFAPLARKKLEVLNRY